MTMTFVEACQFLQNNEHSGITRNDVWNKLMGKAKLRKGHAKNIRRLINNQIALVRHYYLKNGMTDNLRDIAFEYLFDYEHLLNPQPR